MIRLLTILSFLWSPNLLANNNGGILCISNVLSKAPNPTGWQKRQSIQVGKLKKVDFVGMPKTVFGGLDLDKKHLVRIFWDEKQIASWWLKFPKGITMMAVSFRPGYWRSEPVEDNRCRKNAGA